MNLSRVSLEWGPYELKRCGAIGVCVEVRLTGLQAAQG